MASASNNSSTAGDVCSICVDDYIHPVELPCGHIFCYLCIKGSAFHQKKCPLCRKRFTVDFFKNPKLVTVNSISNRSTSFSVNKQTWFYEGQRGWWEYEERAVKEIEEHFCQNDDDFELQIAGYVYIINFKNMTQARKNQTGRTRRIKRDVANCDKIGVAGIKSFQKDDHTSDSSSAS